MSVSTFPASTGSKLQPYEQLFTSSGTWTRPTGVTQVEVEMIAGSGFAGSGNASGAGGYYKGVVPVTGNVAITIGAGGPSNSKGGDTSFGSLVKCVGSNSSSTDYNSGYVVFPSQQGFSSTAVYESTVISNLGYQQYYHVQQYQGMYYMTGNQNYSYWGPSPFAMYSSPFTYGQSQYYSPKLQGRFISGTGMVYALTNVNHASTQYYNGGVAFTTDSGYSYTMRDSGAAYIAGFVAGGDAFYVSQVNNNVLRKTTNLGSVWTDVTTNLPNGYSYSLFYTNGRYYALTTTGGASNSVYSSTDAVTWAAITVPYAPSQYQYVGIERQVYVDSTSLYYHGHGNWNGVMKITGTTAQHINLGFGSFSSPVVSAAINCRYMYGQNNGLYDITTGGLVVPNFFSTYSTSAISGFESNAFYANANNWSNGPTLVSPYAGLPNHKGSAGASAGCIGAAKYATNGAWISGPGTDKGWGYGADNSLTHRAFGAGIGGSQVGNQGAVLVRWWA